MAHFSNKIHVAFNKFLDSCEDTDLATILRSEFTSPGEVNHQVDFNSDDFQLLYAGASKGEPKECHMLEVRANKKSSHSGLQLLASKSSKNSPPNQKRFALILVADDVMPFMSGAEVRDALRASPVWDKQVINKVLVKWNKEVKWDRHPNDPARMPVEPPGQSRLDFIKIPFEDFNEDGTRVVKGGAKQSKAGKS